MDWGTIVTFEKERLKLVCRVEWVWVTNYWNREVNWWGWVEVGEDRVVIGVNKGVDRQD